MVLAGPVISAMERVVGVVGAAEPSAMPQVIQAPVGTNQV